MGRRQHPRCESGVGETVNVLELAGLVVGGSPGLADSKVVVGRDWKVFDFVLFQTFSNYMHFPLHRWPSREREAESTLEAAALRHLTLHFTAAKCKATRPRTWSLMQGGPSF